MSLKTFDFFLANGKSVMCVFELFGLGKFDLVEIVERPLGTSCMKALANTEELAKICEKAEREFGNAGLNRREGTGNY